MGLSRNWLIEFGHFIIMYILLQRGVEEEKYIYIFLVKDDFITHVVPMSIEKDKTVQL